MERVEGRELGFNPDCTGDLREEFSMRVALGKPHEKEYLLEEAR